MSEVSSVYIKKAGDLPISHLVEALWNVLGSRREAENLRYRVDAPPDTSRDDKIMARLAADEARLCDELRRFIVTAIELA